MSRTLCAATTARDLWCGRAEDGCAQRERCGRVLCDRTVMCGLESGVGGAAGARWGVRARRAKVAEHVRAARGKNVLLFSEISLSSYNLSETIRSQMKPLRTSQITERRKRAGVSLAPRSIRLARRSPCRASPRLAARRLSFSTFGVKSSQKESEIGPLLEKPWSLTFDLSPLPAKPQSQIPPAGHRIAPRGSPSSVVSRPLWSFWAQSTGALGAREMCSGRVLLELSSESSVGRRSGGGRSRRRRTSCRAKLDT